MGFLNFTLYRKHIDTIQLKSTVSITYIDYIQYIEMMETLCDFIKAQRTGNWLLHLSVVRSSLPFLAFSGYHHVPFVNVKIT